MDEQQRQFDVLDMISLLSFFLGYQNLIENRQQSAQNDVGAANDKQAKFLLEELGRNFEELKAMLREILGVLRHEESNRKE